MIVRAKAPLRLGLAGGGTDVSPYSDEYGGYVLNATIDMYSYCTIEITNDDKIAFYAADKDEYYETSKTPYIELNGELSLHKGIYNRLIRDYDLGSKSFRVTTYSDAPVGSGLGSSSTLVVAMIKAFAEALNLPLGEYDIAHLAFQIERLEVGLSGGKQDHYSASFGGVNFMEFYANDRVIVNPLRIKDWILNELENSMILYYTGQSRESASIIEQQIESVVNKNDQSIEAMHQLKKDALIMKEAILKGNILKFAEYMDRSWKAKKKMASLITNDYLNEIYDMAMQAGAVAGKVSGAGGGGFFMFMVDPLNRHKLIQRLNQNGGKVYNFHFAKDGVQAWRI